MIRIIVVLGIIGIVAVAFGINRAPTPAPPILDVPEMVASGFVPGRGASEERQGRLYWSTSANKHFRWLEIASFASRGRPEIVTGEFVEVIKGRSQALHMLGADDTYDITDETPETVVHVGGRFAEFTLFRTAPYVDEYSGFFAATRVGLVNLE